MICKFFYVALVCSVLPSAALAANARVIVTRALHHDVSPALRNIPIPPALPGPPRHRIHEQEQWPRIGNSPLRGPDPVLQTDVRNPLPIIDVAKFDGLDCCHNNTPYYWEPPDVNGTVGTTQYMQIVNEGFAVFDKQKGNILYGPAPDHLFWTGFGGPCQDDVGDVIAQFDKLARRWIVLGFGADNNICLAVSVSSDATGAYYRYAFAYGSFPDYPKLGVWPDGYYLSLNFSGTYVCALHRAAILQGRDATSQCFQLGYYGVVPSDLDGTMPPPRGATNYLATLSSNSLNFWQFHVNWTNPQNSRLSGPVNLAVPAFSPGCNSGDPANCIPQKGTTQKLDSLSYHMMYRLAYRNFGDHQSLVATHAVDVGSRVGERWYEIRNPGASPVLYQAGTYAPKGTSSRWMGSIGMDKNGDIALGYSVSGSAVYPAIHYTGRVPTDSLGTMEGENAVQAGLGYHTINRWGDYTDMTIDPVDDCTFYYTNEYLPNSGAFNWMTKINAFRFEGCQ